MYCSVVVAMLDMTVLVEMKLEVSKLVKTDVFVNWLTLTERQHRRMLAECREIIAVWW